MPKLATLLQVRREMGITFVPYAQFRVQTRLSPEECAACLQAVTQPQKLPTLFSARTSPEAHLLLKGMVTRTGFLAVPVDSTGMRKYQGAQPFWLRGRFQPAFGGTDVVVQVFPSILGLLTTCVMVLATLLETVFGIEKLSSPDATDRLLAVTLLPEVFVGVLFCWAALALPVSFRAYKMKNALRQVLSE